MARSAAPRSLAAGGAGVPSRVLAQHRQIVALFLHHRDEVPITPSRRGLVTALCSSRGELNAGGETEPLDGAEWEAVRFLTDVDLRAAIGAIEPARMESSLEAFVRASGENGDDVSLAQPAEEAEALLEQGCHLLYARQDLENVMAGFVWVLDRRPELSHLGRQLEEKRVQAARFDRRLRGAIQHFVPLNRRRRLNRAAYPDARRFWWWHLLSDCDLAAVHAAVEQELPLTAHVSVCPHCGEWLRRLRRIRAMLRQSPHVEHPSFGDLLRLRQGELAGEEEEGMGWHLKLCELCSAGMALLPRRR